jgi:hypothetical protein
MRTMLACAVVLLWSAAAGARDLVFEGTWVTTNRPLDGTLTCVVTDLGNNEWRGHFSGTWQGTTFSYRVDFRGPADNLRGRAVIDGAHYEWTGAMSKGQPGWFKGKFTGDRYEGSFNLKQKGND